MKNCWNSSFVIAATAVGLLAVTQIAQAQSTDTTKSQPTDTTKSQHMQGGTQPGPGTHGHSSSPKPGETKEIQQQQHDMPATPSHSGGPRTGKP